MNKSELQSKTLSQLRSLVARNGVKGYRQMSKAQLIAALLAPPQPPQVAAAPIGTVPAPGESTELPENYNQTRLTLMEVDPYQVYAFWEITESDRTRLTKRLGTESDGSNWVLRFYETTQVDLASANPQSQLDVTVDLAARNWYVNIPASGKSYCAELGSRTGTGRFEVACRSNIVHIPRAKESPHYQPEWLRVKESTQAVECVPAPAPSPVFVEPKPKAKETPAASTTVPTPAAPVTAPVSTPAATAPVQTGTEKPAPVASADIKPADATPVPNPADQPALTNQTGKDPALLPPLGKLAGEFPLIGQETRENGQPAAKHSSNGQSSHEPARPTEITQTSPTPAATPEASATSSPISESAATTQNTSNGSSPSTSAAENSSPINASSWSISQAETQIPSIRLELNAEVIVYGRAEPGQTLVVNGQSIKVNADGTFRVEWALPVRKE